MLANYFLTHFWILIYYAFFRDIYHLLSNYAIQLHIKIDMYYFVEFRCLRGEAFSLVWLLVNLRFFFQESQVSGGILDL